MYTWYTSSNTWYTSSSEPRFTHSTLVVTHGKLAVVSLVVHRTQSSRQDGVRQSNV